MDTINNAVADQYLRLAEAFRPPSPEADPEARSAYAHLFVIPGQALASPYESVQREGRLMGQAAAEVSTLYAEAGLQLSSGSGELPDHLSIELAFMAHMADLENSDPVEADRWRACQRSFLELHLAAWIPSLCRQILTDDAHTYYHAAARLALQRFEADHKRLAPKSGPGNAEDTTQHTVGLSRSPVGRRRHPNVTFQVVSSACTLCTLCTDACKRGALAVRCTTSSISLVFKAAACNGCRACARLCPEGAVRLHHGPALSAPATGEARVVLTAPRVICPSCKQPHIALPWMKRLHALMRDQKTIEGLLLYCPLCKVRVGERLSNPATAGEEEWPHD